MSLHSAHTDSGITPQRMSRAKIAQPKQNPTNASNEAAPANMAITTRDAVCASANHSTEPATEKSAPIPWANLFGGPGTRRCSRLMRGVMICVEILPNGLRNGPVHTRAIKPYVSGKSSHGFPVITKATLMTTAPPATMRAEVSLTGFGNPKTLAMPSR